MCDLAELKQQDREVNGPVFQFITSGKVNKVAELLSAGLDPETATKEAILFIELKEDTTCVHNIIAVRGRTLLAAAA